MSNKQKVFIAISIVFFVVVGLIVYDMASYTKKPWGKKKKVEQAK
ncbi:MAG: hypothetical protein ACKVOU_06920 [Cytophagales bacterium]